MIELIREFGGAKHFKLNTFSDERGSFLKILHGPTFKQMGLATEWPESYVSVSKPGVVRGLHFQLPPHDHDKFVIVLQGEVHDLALDLRKRSLSYKKHHIFQVREGEAVYIPKGFAHGFRVPGPLNAQLLYFTGTIHQPSHDSGILWSSLGLDWPLAGTITSDRDKKFPSLAEFDSPF